MGNLQTGLSFIMPVLTLVIGFLLNKQIPDVWRSANEETNVYTRRLTKGLVIGIFGGIVLLLLLFAFVGGLIFVSPDLPAAQPLIVSINFNSSSGVANISNIDCTPAFSCEKFCPSQNFPQPTVIIKESKLCNQTPIYRPIVLTLPINCDFSKMNKPRIS
jgi:hypothetical protein